ncbi:MAG: hypothetical protein RLY31_256 [Bacteroidota bacterium]
MQSRRIGGFDVLVAGEYLLDLISTNFTDDFASVEAFRPVAGGSAANLCANMARLGNGTKLACTLGDDQLGHHLRATLERLDVDTSLVRHVTQPTTLILVTRSENVPHFEAYRQADVELLPSQLGPEQAASASLFHTTCFALSRQPAQDTILTAAEAAAAAGRHVSIDLNYALPIWPDRKAAQQVVSAYCGLGALVKVSEVDWERLYGAPLQDPEEVCRHFLSVGAAVVCLTLGGEGAWVADRSNLHFLPARPVKVADTTGAGDAFWSGFLTAWLDGADLLACARAARRMAELKIGTFGNLPDRVDKASLYELPS